MIEIFRIAATSWPLTVLVLGVGSLLLVRRYMHAREVAEDRDYILKSEAARTVPNIGPTTVHIKRDPGVV